MNKESLVTAVRRKTGLMKKDIEATIDATIETITETLIAGEKVQLLGFGTFDVKSRAARTGRNPRKNTPVEIPARRALAFRPSVSLKSAVDTKRDC